MPLNPAINLSVQPYVTRNGPAVICCFQNMANFTATTTAAGS